MLPFPDLEHPIVQAPLAGGPSTAELAAAVSGAGGLGFLAAGYRTADEVRAELVRVRALTGAPVGLNLFLLRERAVDAGALERYARSLAPDAERIGVELGTARFEDDELTAKLDVALELRPAVVSFTFGCPDAALVEGLHECGIAVWVTVTEPDEAVEARDAGADAVVVQGVEAGGHRGGFDDEDGRGEVGLLPLLALVSARVPLPLVAAGGISDGRGVAAVLAAGARAAQLGTAFLRTLEAGTNSAQRAVLPRGGRTALTRAYTGRRARGIVNRFQAEHSGEAPSAYPHVHHLTAPLRAAARAAGDAEATNLWAGQAFALAEERAAADLVRAWSEDARAALVAAQQRFRIGR